MHRRTLRWLAALASLTLLMAFWAAPARNADAAAPGANSHMACDSSANGNFTLTATDGYINTTDGNVIYMWGYGLGSRGFQYPGPVLCVNQGQTVTITLVNQLSFPVSVMFPGIESVTANGQPAQPQFNGATLTSLVQAAPANGSVTYSFVASRPGSFLYQSGTEPGRQVGMGLFGALVVRPSQGANFAYNRADSQFNPSTEYLALLSEIDPLMHQAAETNTPYDMNSYHPQYFLLNGRTFPDTLAPNNASWLPSQPYGALVHIQPYSATANPQPALVHYMNAGSHLYNFHPHGNHSIVIGRDAQALEGPAAEDLATEQFSLPLDAGQTWDVLFKWQDAESWNGTTNQIPVTVPQQQDLTLGPYFSGSPYLGSSTTLPPGTESYNQCGEYYHLAHNHALDEITSWGGVTMSGQITYTRIDPPSPNSCP